MANMKYWKTNKNGTEYFTDNTCQRCGGKGNGGWYVDGGVCYECGGSGVSKTRIIKKYTSEYQAVMDSRRYARNKKKQDAEFDANILGQAAYLKDKGFNEAGKTYVVIGDTYSIKDEIKEAGGKWSNYIGWNFTNPVEGFQTIMMSKEECFVQNTWGNLNWNEETDFKAIIKERTPKEATKESNFFGEVGGKIDLVLEYIYTFAWENNFAKGYWTNSVTYIHKFKDADGNIYTWKTSLGMPDAEIGQKYNVKGNIKEHSEYKSEKQTVLTRCKVEGGEAA